MISGEAVELDLFPASLGGSTPTSPLQPKELRVIPVSRGVIADFIEKHHYSANVNGVKSDYCFGVYHNQVAVGAAMLGQMSTTAWEKFGNCESEVVELRRFVMLDCVGKNGESRVLGWIVRWLKKNAPHLSVIVSYADPNEGHTGVIYKATNFEFFGMSAADVGYRDADGNFYHSRALRTKYRAEYKPFVKKLRGMMDRGELEVVPLPPKFTYVYYLKD